MIRLTYSTAFKNWMQGYVDGNCGAMNMFNVATSSRHGPVYLGVDTTVQSFNLLPVASATDTSLVIQADWHQPRNWCPGQSFSPGWVMISGF
jgi:hypothetical protein